MDLGLTTYCVAETVHQKVLGDVKAGFKAGTIILAEFLPVYTIGRSGSTANILVSQEFLAGRGIKCHKINRGGDVTLHNPGQLVVYPVFNLAFLKKDVGWYLRLLEEIIIGTLSGFGIQGERAKGRTGVWVNGEKIASIGIAVSRWVTYHGAAINVNNDLSYFDYINPCGIKGCRMTSIAKLGRNDIGIAQVKDGFIRQFEKMFGVVLDAEIGAEACMA
jgi:lipoyl(octanoyl) transferase